MLVAFFMFRSPSCCNKTHCFNSKKYILPEVVTNSLPPTYDLAQTKTQIWCFVQIKEGMFFPFVFNIYAWDCLISLFLLFSVPFSLSHSLFLSLSLFLFLTFSFSFSFSFLPLLRTSKQVHTHAHKYIQTKCSQLFRHISYFFRKKDDSSEAYF